MISFSKPWTDVIAEVTTKPEYQTADVRLEDPSLLIALTEYDIETGEQEFEGDPVLYEGRARIIGVRWGVETGGESQRNASTLKAIRVQFPQRSVTRVRKGCVLYVNECPGNPVLEGLSFTTTNDFQGSSAAARTIEFMLDGDVRLA